VWERTDGLSKCWSAVPKKKKKMVRPKIKCEREVKKW
jgi:hypothetical protein